MSTPQTMLQSMSIPQGIATVARGLDVFVLRRPNKPHEPIPAPIVEAGAAPSHRAAQHVSFHIHHS
jgi:hypothetical protein